MMIMMMIKLTHTPPPLSMPRDQQSSQQELAALQAQMENLRLEKATLEERNAQLLTRTAKLEKDLQV